MLRKWNRERREKWKDAETLWRCLSCGGLYGRLEETGATCPSCEKEQAARVPMARDTIPEVEHPDQDE